MALTEKRILISYEIHTVNNAVNILWENQILRDGEVINRESHRGAYELINGDLPAHIMDEFNISITALAGEALLSFTKANADLHDQLNTAIAGIETLNQSLAYLQQQLVGANDEIAQLTDALAQAGALSSDGELTNA